MGGEIGTAEMKVIQYNSANTCQNSSCQNYNMKIGYIFRWKKKKKNTSCRFPSQVKQQAPSNS